MVADALRKAGESTTAHDEAFGQDTTDLEWLADVGRRGWVVLTKDARMYTIMRNLCVDHIRKASLRRHPSLDEARPGDDGDGPTLGEQTADKRVRSDVERTAAGTRLQARMLTAIDGLPAEQREVFLMRELSNLRFKEIADITGVPENTVKSRMRYALEHLQEALGEFEEHARALR